VALEGFSDGASYALSLGIGNGDLFTHLIAFSPGFAAPSPRSGARGCSSPTGSTTRSCRSTAAAAGSCRRSEGAGYDVTYDEFDGGHVVPPELARRAVAWVG
jgi:phospholipase/carboxylesterase